MNVNRSSSCSRSFGARYGIEAEKEVLQILRNLTKRAAKTDMALKIIEGNGIKALLIDDMAFEIYRTGLLKLDRGLNKSPKEVKMNNQIHEAVKKLICAVEERKQNNAVSILELLLSQLKKKKVSGNFKEENREKVYFIGDNVIKVQKPSCSNRDNNKMAVKYMGKWFDFEPNGEIYELLRELEVQIGLTKMDMHRAQMAKSIHYAEPAVK